VNGLNTQSVFLQSGDTPCFYAQKSPLHFEVGFVKRDKELTRIVLIHE